MTAVGEGEPASGLCGIGVREGLGGRIWGVDSSSTLEGGNCLANWSSVLVGMIGLTSWSPILAKSGVCLVVSSSTLDSVWRGPLVCLGVEVVLGVRLRGVDPVDLVDLADFVGLTA